MGDLEDVNYHVIRGPVAGGWEPEAKGRSSFANSLQGNGDLDTKTT